ncbi:PREDICTED: uncharacterized protein LOC105597941 isoform X1 [Cercocebus atys]|uniref:uncharacterized protein LOC105597941 isoform X1 n=1 Tax=Cercocebus atys TaxID=9531 RepID=UPI0005F3B8A5|nr:PREDICTED: uncharacterized protein LOC105597941 isoform X1 [Cercocebus atys]
MKSRGGSWSLLGRDPYHQLFHDSGSPLQPSKASIKYCIPQVLWNCLWIWLWLATPLLHVVLPPGPRLMEQPLSVWNIVSHNGGHKRDYGKPCFVSYNFCSLLSTFH